MNERLNLINFRINEYMEELKTCIVIQRQYDIISDLIVLMRERNQIVNYGGK